MTVNGMAEKKARIRRRRRQQKALLSMHVLSLARSEAFATSVRVMERILPASQLSSRCQQFVMPLGKPPCHR